MPPSPIDPSTLIFPSAHTTISKTLTDLKRSNLSISNRLHSIKQDSVFVQKVAEAYDLPVVANERCGSWYIPTPFKAGSVYFKSTDGHHGQWSLSLRRLNLQVLEIIGEKGGCIIVDSTRRGKSMPDALSKTVPIWIAVLNRLVFPDAIDSHHLQVPSNVVSRSEAAQIEARLPSFVADVQSLSLNVDSLEAKLGGRPMRAEWVTPDDLPSPSCSSKAEETLVVLCTASGRSVSSTDPTYVQGAADDSESWACGLDAATFWSHEEGLLSTSEDELPAVIAQLVNGARTLSSVRRPILIKPTSNIWIADNAAIATSTDEYDIVISCSEKPDPLLSAKLKSRYIHLTCSTGKVGSRQLRSQLPKLEVLRGMLSPTSKTLVTCRTGKDLSVGVALAVICLLYNESGNFQSTKPITGLDKTVIKQRLSWIMVSMPDASPSRATLQSVNAFLLG